MQQTTPQQAAERGQTGISRRRFLAGAAGAAALAAPSISIAQAPIKLRMQTGFNTKDIFYEYGAELAAKIKDMSGGRLVLEVLPAGAVVKVGDMLDAVHAGTLDACHAAPGYWYGKNAAVSLFGTGPCFGMDGWILLGWVEHGGGRAMYEELMQKELKMNVQGFLMVPMPTQPLGWFKKEVKSAADFKGLKYRTVGLSIDLFKELGATVVFLPGPDIVPGLDRGLIDAAEFNNPSSDRLLGFPDVSKVCMVQSYHQPMEVQEILINKKKYDALAPELKAIIKHACSSHSSDMYFKAMDRNSKDYVEMKGKGIKFVKTPKELLRAQLEAWDRIEKRKVAENPWFAKIIASQRKWAERVVTWYEDITVTNDMAVDHYFKKS
jgi:TRAP-type mannitol/chloroaromatic compound transport system substrate-binding protein